VYGEPIYLLAKRSPLLFSEILLSAPAAVELLIRLASAGSSECVSVIREVYRSYVRTKKIFVFNDVLVEAKSEFKQKELAALVVSLLNECADAQSYFYKINCMGLLAKMGGGLSGRILDKVMAEDSVRSAEYKHALRKSSVAKEIVENRDPLSLYLATQGDAY
jgi:hypothetical protein